MKWNLGLVAGAVLLTGCDMRTEPEVYLGMRVHIRERCSQGMYEYPDVIALDTMRYCSCLVDRLTEGKSRSAIIQMEQNPALYMEPNADVVRQCTDVARPNAASSNPASES